MSVKYQDYYDTLGVARTASQEEISKAYRKLARQYHPDVNKAKDAEARFRVVTEAYEVLKDPAKRKQYDELGSNWKAGQEFRPPQGWEEQFRRAGGNGSGGRGRAAQGGTTGTGGFDFSGGDNFSDFFESIFGGSFRSGAAGAGRASASRGKPRSAPGQDQSADITISLADAMLGGTRHVELEVLETDAMGSQSRSTRAYDVKIPAGTTDGSVIRLSGQGSSGTGGGPSGDLHLKIHIAPDPRFDVEGHDLRTIIPVSPSEAVLGAKVVIPLPNGQATVTIPPRSQSGQRLRLRGKGLPKRSKGKEAAEAGDLLAEIRVTVPKSPSEQELALYEQLAKESNFNPRES